MGMRSVWIWLGGCVTGAILLAFVMYPPQPNWGSSEKWGDVPTWLGAIATFLAVAVALFLPEVQEARRRSAKRVVAARLFYDEAERLVTVAVGMCGNIEQAVGKSEPGPIEVIAYQATQQALLALDGLAASADAFSEDDAAKIAHAISAMRAIDRRFAIIRRWRDTKAADSSVLSDIVSLGRTSVRELETAGKAVAAAAEVLKAHGGVSIVDRGMG